MPREILYPVSLGTLPHERLICVCPTELHVSPVGPGGAVQLGVAVGVAVTVAVGVAVTVAVAVGVGGGVPVAVAVGVG